MRPPWINHRFRTPLFHELHFKYVNPDTGLEKHRNIGAATTRRESVGVCVGPVSRGYEWDVPTSQCSPPGLEGVAPAGGGDSASSCSDKGKVNTVVRMSRECVAAEQHKNGIRVEEVRGWADMDEQLILVRQHPRRMGVRRWGVFVRTSRGNPNTNAKS